MTPTEIVIKNLSHSFGTGPLFANLNCTIQAGERVALTGGNGAGKTTLLRILTTLLLPASGDIWIDGLSIREDAQAIRKKTGWVPAQDGGFFPRLTGYQNLLCFGALRTASRSEIQEVIHIFSQLEPFREALKTPFCLCSSGMKQSLSLARALLGNPSLLLMDEPTRSLDFLSATRFQSFLSESFNPLTLVFSTHELHSNLKFQRKLHLQHGGLIEV